ncbi:MAG: chemotaxis protein [Alphaproteobacteria bacterium CG11_big_fil_rev_8_21_14_0_20_44_7]|nr:MAG: chemotaxis protein [Alphaproteobacteria bacterium CG11_big_fil_rev_8_21_14_0_20_44_7]
MLSRNSNNTGSTNWDFKALVENMPIAVMICNIKNFTIDYVNPKSVELLDAIRDVLKVKPENIVGTSIDVFHKNPQHQRNMLADDSHLPHSAIIEVGGQYLDLNISAIYDNKDKYTHAMLSWSIVTDKIEKDRETERLMEMLDNMPINVMTCELKDFKINYVNQTSLNTLKSVEQHLPIKVEQLLGSSIDVFHKAPEHQRRLLADPANLPHKANIKLGDQTLNLSVSAIKDSQGKYLGPMLTWAVITENIRMAENVTKVVEDMTETSQQADDSADNMLEIVNRTQELSSSVSAASEEMSVSIQEISQRITEVSKMSQESAEQAANTDKLVSTLEEAAKKIGNITEVIEEIADKTNLLALNATIEAARAGDAGKGFAVVAAEVKDLAKQTATATTEIQQQINNIQGVTGSVVQAIESIGKSITEFNEIATQIASAVEEQTATTSEVSQSISGVNDAAQQTGEAARNVKGVASKLSDISEMLSTEVNQFMENVKS